jgi:hypothetical protein
MYVYVRKSIFKEYILCNVHCSVASELLSFVLSEKKNHG